MESSMATAREDDGDFAALADVRIRIEDYLTRHMREMLGEREGLLARTTEHVLSAPGKLLRPLLLLDACHAAGGDPERIFSVACGTEYGHIASLIHDDIMDGDESRRGQPALHIQFDLPAAILTGDLLIFQTYLSYAECADGGVEADRVLAAIRDLSRTCIEMCRGQAMEAAIIGRLDTPEETYLELIRLKTAGFCSTAARIGARLGGASEDAIRALSQYGLYLGMAFQIVDDLLCYTGDGATLGKPVLSDARNHRVTLPVIYAMQSDDRAVADRLRELFHVDGTVTQRKLRHLLGVSRALERTRACAYRYTVKAIRELERLEYSAARERLRALAEMLLSREQ
jgi:geranylgeranyl diphosphate synthase type I